VDNAHLAVTGNIGIMQEVVQFRQDFFNSHMAEAQFVRGGRAEIVFITHGYFLF
jgi:hypothetical protein